MQPAALHYGANAVIQQSGCTYPKVGLCTLNQVDP
jgi:hypothetical protein